MSDHDDLLRDLIDEPIEPGHMDDMLAGVEDRLERQRRRRRRGVISGSLAAAVALAMLLVPVSYTAHVGTHVFLSWPREWVAAEIIEAELAGLDGLAARKTAYADDMVLYSAVIRGSGEDDAAERIRSAIRVHFPAGAGPEIETRPIVRRIQGNALAALSNGHFRVNARGLDDSELEQAILEELGLMGLLDPEVSIAHTEEGRLLIDVQTADSPVDSFTFEITF